MRRKVKCVYWGKQFLWVRGAAAGLWWVGNEWDVRKQRPFVQPSLSRKLAVNGRHTVQLKATQSVGRG